MESHPNEAAVFAGMLPAAVNATDYSHEHSVHGKHTWHVDSCRFTQ